MTPEQVAQKYERRTGFELVDYAEVGLPVYRLLTEVVTVSTREISTIKEFVLRLIAVGATDESFISGILGLPSDLVSLSILEMRDQRWIFYPDDGLIQLTEKGQEVYSSRQDRLPQDETIWIDFDALTRKPISLGREITAKPSELTAAGRIEIRPYPAEPPRTEDLAAFEVQEVVRRQIGRRDEGTEILALNKISRRLRLFRNAVCLVYKAQKSRKIEIEFAVNGLLAEEHGRIFAANKGPEKMGFVEGISENDIRLNLRRLLGDAASKKMATPEEVSKARVRVSAAQMLFNSAQASHLRGKAKHDDVALAKKLEDARARLSEAMAALEQFPVRPLAVHEHLFYLQEAIGSATQRLVISTPFLLSTVVDYNFIRSLNQLIAANVEIEIFVQAPPSAEYRRKNSSVDELYKMESRSSRMKLVQMSKTPINWLVKDGEYAITSSFPWLAFRDSRRSFRRESGLIVRDAELVGDLLAKLKDRELES